MIVDWPMNIGEPNFSYLENMLSFVPISFEFTVYVLPGMAITYLLKNRTLPGMPAQNPDPVQQMMFVLEIKLADNSMDEKELEKLIKDTGYIEIDKK